MSRIGVHVGGLDRAIRHRLLASLRGDPHFYIVSPSSIGESHDRPAVVVLDESISYAELRSWQELSNVLVLADSPSCLFGSLLLTVGVSCLAKGEVSERAATVIRLVASKKYVFDQAGNCSYRAALSPRELEVYDHLRAGRRPAEIAVLLGIAVATVRTHCENIRVKLGAKSIREISGMPPLQASKGEEVDS